MRRVILIERETSMSLLQSPAVDTQRRQLIKAAAATAVVGAGSALAFPAIAQAKPFAGLKLRGAAYQHGFFNILR